MPLQFQPKKESEIKRFKVLPAGDYPFTVLASQEQASKSTKNAGKLMCAVKLNVHGPDSDQHVYDYFADWFSEWKLKHFLETTGNANAYLTGNVDSSQNAWDGFEGFVKVEVEEATGSYAEKNVVVDYLPKKNQTVEALDFSNPTAASKVEKPKAATPAADSTPPPDDDIPF